MVESDSVDAAVAARAYVMWFKLKLEMTDAAVVAAAYVMLLTVNDASFAAYVMLLTVTDYQNVEAKSPPRLRYAGGGTSKMKVNPSHHSHDWLTE